MFVGLGGSVLRPLRNTEEVRRGERRPMWRAARLGPEALAITSLAISPAFAEDHTVFAATNAGVFISRDGGEVFEPWNDGLDKPRVVSLAISRNGELVYALGLGGSVWRREITRQATRAR